MFESPYDFGTSKGLNVHRMKHKVAELEGALLDAAVAGILGWKCHDKDGARRFWRYEREGVYYLLGELDFSSDWALGGPIIERERIDTSAEDDGWTAARWTQDGNHLANGDFSVFAHGPTPLIAAMRAYVASRLGDEVEL